MSEVASEQTPKVSANILKSQSDPSPLHLETTEAGTLFRLSTDEQCSWAKAGDEIGIERLRNRIEPWLTALFQSEHLSLLVGSGLTHAVHSLAASTPLPGMGKAKFGVYQSRVNTAADVSAKKADRDKANIEDQIRVANELLTGLDIYCPPSSTFYGSVKLRSDIERLRTGVAAAMRKFADSILAGERDIAIASEGKRNLAFGKSVSFLMSFASRSGTRERLQLFTTNYDRLIEKGAEVAGLHLIDRFVGTLSPIFRSSRLDVDMHYNPPGIRGEPRYLEGVVRFTKLHGSVDWVSVGRNIHRFGLPFGAGGVEAFLQGTGLAGVTARSLMIYPNSAKDRETAVYPYVELFRDFAASVCRPNSTLVTFGYSFGDEHINRIVEDMLTIPSTHLVVISYGDPLGRIMKTYNRIARPAQTTLLVGDHVGNLDALVSYYLPKPAIDLTTSRMAKLLRNRIGVEEASERGQGDTGGDSK